jgi:hypothetical protein
MFPALAIVALATEHIVIIVLAAVVVAALIGFVFRQDIRLFNKRKHYNRVAAWCREHKLPHTAAIFESLGVGDTAEAVGRAETLAHLVEEPKTADTLLDANFEYQLETKVKDSAWRMKIQTALNATVVPNPTPGSVPAK